MSKNTPTFLIYENNIQLSELYENILNAMIVIEEAYLKRYDTTTKYCYGRDTKRRFFKLIKPAFKGTYDEYCQKYYEPRDEFALTTRAYMRMKALHDIVGDAIRENLKINLSLADHIFINQCLTAGDCTITMYNASLDY